MSEDLGIALSTVSNFLNAKPVDRATFEEICSKLGLAWKEIADWGGEAISQSDENLPAELIASATAEVDQDWGEAPDSVTFYGREVELALLEQWVVEDHCRLVLLLGMGGAGKTALSVKLLEQIGDRFDMFVWRSLRNAPPLKTLLSDLILSLSHQQATLPDRLEVQFSKLVELLRQRRCLLVLDNAESVLQSGGTGQYQEGYEAYEALFTSIANGRHQSSLIVTSREQPRSLTAQIGETKVRSLSLTGLSLESGKQILAARGLVDSNQSFQKLVHAYSGNPLAIKIAAATICSTFSGNIHSFLQQQVVAYGGIWDLLDQQFDRLNQLEQQVMYWLAIEREWVAFADLFGNWIPTIAQRQLLEALESLQGRSLIETSKAGFTQQPVVMEYMTQKLIDHCHQEITNQTLHLCKSHALLKAQAQDYIREIQVRLILQPTAQTLLTTFNGKATVEFLVDQLLGTLRGKPLSYTGYAAGNLINLLQVLQSDLSDRNFAELVIAQAYLADATLHRTNFTDASLHRSVLTETLGGVVSVAFSPDGQRIAASDTRGEIHVWQIHSGQKLLTLSGHHSWIFSLVFSPNGITLASASDDYVVKLWDVATGDCLQALRGPANLLNAITFSPDERRIMNRLKNSDSKNATIQLWDVEAPEQQIAKLQGFTYLARAIAFSPDRQTIAVSTATQNINLWNLQTGHCEATLKSHYPTVVMLAFSRNGQYLASTSLNPAIQIWDLATHQCLHSLEGHTEGISQMDFSPDHRYLVSSSFDQTVKIWEVATGRCLRTLYGHGKKLMAVALSADGTQIASGGDDHAVKLWDLQTGQCIKTFQGYTNIISSIALCPDRQTLVSGHEDKTLRLWDLPNGQLTQTIQGHSDIVWTVAFSPLGEFMVSTSADHTVKLWNVQQGACWVSQEHRNWVWTAAFHPRGDLLATGSYDKTIKLWDVQTGACLRTLSDHTNPVLCVCFSPDGSDLVSSSFDQTIRVWEVETGRCLRVLRGHSDRIWQAALSSDGQQIASCSHDQTIKLWDQQTGTCLKTLTGHQGAVTSICFSPDDRQLVSGGFDQTIRIWDIDTGKCLRTLRGHTSGILTVLWQSIAGTNETTPLIISSSLDGTIKLWQAETGVCLKTLRPPRPYEGMNITRLTGLTEAQQETLRELGAIEVG
ncbi:MAG TPA: NB-ARC domain-containing protein [Trichocoleus sp.]